MRLPTSMRVVVEQFKQTLRLSRLYALNRYAKLIPPGPRYERFLYANGLICSRADDEEGNCHAGGNRHRAFNVKVPRRAPPNCGRNVPVLFGKANHARYREGWRPDMRGSQVHGPESTGGLWIRPFPVGRELCPLSSGSFV
ncbi:hypothetical protein NSND_60733 [Nitrospira sp. ND1]|nr:hypothetical protein NSND_60733 [Nitrospira sp. ND1]